MVDFILNIRSELVWDLDENRKKIMFEGLHLPHPPPVALPQAPENDFFEGARVGVCVSLTWTEPNQTFKSAIFTILLP